jgi:radical SAM superfamily enzyme YgiQ (UPF0313 family)
MKHLTKTKEIYSISDATQNYDYFELTNNLRKLLNEYELLTNNLIIITPPLQHPKTLDKDVVKSKGYHLYPPLGQIYIANSIHENSIFKCQTYDMHLDMLRRCYNDEDYDMGTLLNSIKEDYDAYLVSCMFSTSENIYKEVGKKLKTSRKLVIFGGVYSTGFSEDILSKQVADIVIKHEGEVQINNLLGFWNKSEHSEILNLAFNYNNNIYDFSKKYEKVKPASIKKELIKIKDTYKDYSKYGTFGHITTALVGDRVHGSIIGNRGCRSSCTFCSVRNFMGPKVRSTETSITIETIKYMYNDLGVRHIDWLDDDLVAYKDQTIELFNEISKLNYDLKFTIQNAVLARDINEELVDALVSAGFVQIGFGVESGSSEIRRKIQRVTLIDNLKDTINWFREKNPDIFIHCNFMLGFPNEKVSQIIQTIELALELSVDWCQFAVVQALPNTKLWNDFVESNDPRVNEPSKYSPASEAKLEGKTIDDLGLEPIDIYQLDPESTLSTHQLKCVWYPINIMVDFLKNYNYENVNQINKLILFLQAISSSYPKDPVMNYALSYSNKLINELDTSSNYKQTGDELKNNSIFWKSLINKLEPHDTHKILN